MINFEISNFKISSEAYYNLKGKYLKSKIENKVKKKKESVYPKFETEAHSKS